MIYIYIISNTIILYNVRIRTYSSSSVPGGFIVENSGGQMRVLMMRNLSVSGRVWRGRVEFEI